MRMVEKKGSALVAFVLLVPLIVTAFMVFLNIFAYTRAHERLKMAVKRSAYIGAAVFAEGMNNLAYDDWKWHKAYKELSERFKENTKENKPTGEEDKQRFRGETIALYEHMREINEGLFDRVIKTAENVLRKNEKNILFSDYRKGNSDKEVIALGADLFGDQEGTITFAFIEGNDFTDPTGYNFQNEKFTTYLAKEKGVETIFNVTAAREFVFPFSSRYLPLKKVILTAAEYSMAYGGSLKNFALTSADNIEEAKQNGGKYLYKAVLLGGGL